MDKKFKRITPKLLSLILIPLSLLIKWIMSLYPEFIEKYYSQGIYKYFMQPISQLTGLLPFSAGEILLILLVAYILARLIYLIIKAIRLRNWMPFLNFLSNVVLAASICFFILTFTWSINFERLSFAENANIKVRDSSVDELEDLCSFLINNTNTLREQVDEDENGVMKIEGGFSSVSRRAHLGYEAVSVYYPFLTGKYGRPKPVLLSKAMSHTNIIGIYSPFTGEANIDIDMPDIGIPSTAMHEMAHQRGFASEDEANYIAYITCLAHPDIDFKYSGNVLALQYSMYALYEADSDRYKNLTSSYSPAYLRDLKFEQDYWRTYQGVAKEVADKINDGYLKLSGETDGVKSYGRMVDLLLASYRINP